MERSSDQLMTIDELALLPDDGNRYELVDGELQVSPAPGITHQVVLKNVVHLLQNYLDEHPVGLLVPGPGLEFDRYNSVIPDVVYVANERRAARIRGERFVAAPDLVIEIVSPGKANTRRDRLIKPQLYARFGVNEYWVIDPESRFVETYLLEGGVMRLSAVSSDDEELASRLLPGWSCKVAALFAL